MSLPASYAHVPPQRLDYHDLAALLPYGFPWLLVDRVSRWSASEIVVVKAVSGCDHNMSAHLRDGPSIMPGVLLIELVNQAAMLLVTLRSSAGEQDARMSGAGALGRAKATFHSPAYIGDVLTATVRITVQSENKTAYEGHITCGDRAVATVQAIGALVPNSIKHPSNEAPASPQAQ